MTVDEVNRILFVLLSHYNIKFEVHTVGKSAIYEVPKFGTKIVFLDGQEFDNKVLKNWHVAWVHPDYDAKKTREVIVFALVKGGYFHYLRNNYKNTFHRILTFEGWDKSLVKERLRKYGNKPKYNYFKEMNTDAKQESSTFVLSVDPGFYDFLTE